jgi:hypothetical protein
VALGVLVALVGFQALMLGGHAVLAINYHGHRPPSARPGDVPGIGWSVCALASNAFALLSIALGFALHVLTRLATPRDHRDQSEPVRMRRSCVILAIASAAAAVGGPAIAFVMAFNFTAGTGAFPPSVGVRVLAMFGTAAMPLIALSCSALVWHRLRASAG